MTQDTQERLSIILAYSPETGMTCYGDGTYEARDTIKRYGLRWSPKQKVWYFPNSRFGLCPSVMDPLARELDCEGYSVTVCQWESGICEQTEEPEDTDETPKVKRPAPPVQLWQSGKEQEELIPNTVKDKPQPSAIPILSLVPKQPAPPVVKPKQPKQPSKAAKKLLDLL